MGRIIRFGIVGLINTLVNFAVLNFSFYVLMESKLVSSFLATSFALIISFALNRAFVFNSRSEPGRKFLLFAGVTIVGVLIIQNTIYYIGLLVLKPYGPGLANLTINLSGLRLSQNFIEINLSNLLASLVVMTWNYNVYKRLVFNNRAKRDLSQEADVE